MKGGFLAHRDHEAEGSAAGVPCRGCLGARESFPAKGGAANRAVGRIAPSSNGRQPVTLAKATATKGNGPDYPWDPICMPVEGLKRGRHSNLSGFALSTWTPSYIRLQPCA